MYTRILVPVDLDNADKLTKALDLAARTAKANEAEIVFVEVVDAVPTTSARTEGAREASRLTTFAQDQSAAHGIKAAPHIALRGDFHLTVGADVIKAAKQAECDLIVMASHVPGFKDHFLSSNAGYVATHAPMTVYVVR